MARLLLFSYWGGQINNMNKLKYLGAVLIAVAGMGLQQAQAHLLDPFRFFQNGSIGNPTAELNHLQTHGGGSYVPTFLPANSQYLGKFNAGGPIENGAINISTYVTVTALSGNTWQISWNLTGSGFTLDGVLIKTGNVKPFGHGYKFFGVSADETLIGSGTVASFKNPVKDISHITFFGSPGGQVPDGGTTVMLLGAALGALGMARRFLMS
jgi:protein with PEP-CTERM/exosortase system signal